MWVVLRVYTRAPCQGWMGAWAQSGRGGGGEVETAKSAVQKKCKQMHLPPPPLCDIPSGCCSFTGPGQSPVLPFACCVGSLCSVGRCGRCSCWCRFRVRGAQWFGVPGLCWMWRDVPFARQRRPVIGVLRMCWLLPRSFDCFCCPRASVDRPSPCQNGACDTNSSIDGQNKRKLKARQMQKKCEKNSKDAKNDRLLEIQKKGGESICIPPAPSGAELLQAPKAPKKTVGLNKLALKASKKKF